LLCETFTEKVLTVSREVVSERWAQGLPDPLTGPFQDFSNRGWQWPGKGDIHEVEL
jgi:hypothetical protein